MDHIHLLLLLAWAATYILAVLGLMAVPAGILATVPLAAVCFVGTAALIVIRAINKRLGAQPMGRLQQGLLVSWVATFVLGVATVWTRNRLGSVVLPVEGVRFVELYTANAWLTVITLLLATTNFVGTAAAATAAYPTFKARRARRKQEVALRNELMKAEQEIAEVRQRIKAAEQYQSEESRMMEERRQELDALESELQARREARKRAEDELAKLKHEAEHRQKELGNLESDLRNRSEELAELKREAEKGERNSVSLDSQIQQATEMSEDIKNQITEVGRQADAIRQKQLALKREQETLQRRHDTLQDIKQSIPQLENELTNLQEALQLTEGLQPKEFTLQVTEAGQAFHQHIEEFLEHEKNARDLIRRLAESLERHREDDAQILEALKRFGISDPLSLNTATALVDDISTKLCELDRRLRTLTEDRD